MPVKEEVRKAAREMVERYGAAAEHEVEMRIRELREHGETDAVQLWLDIRKAVAALSTTRLRKPN